MSNQTRETLKQYFQTGNTPSQAQFADLIDSALNQVDDAITCDANGLVGIGNSAPAANLGVRGRLFTPLSGTLSVAAGSTAALGAGTSLQTELAVGDAIRIGAQRFTIAGITDATHAELSAAVTAAITAATAYRDTNLLLIENGNGDAQFIIDKSGNVGIGAAAPQAKLHVEGKLLATELAGDGKALTNLQASSLTGTIGVDQVFELPAEKITGQLSPAQLPPSGGIVKGTPDTSLTGTVSTTKTSDVITGVGTLFASELGPNDALRIGDEIFTVASIKDDQYLQIDRKPSEDAITAKAYREVELLMIESGNGARRLSIDKSGTAIWPLRDATWALRAGDEVETASIGTKHGIEAGISIVISAPTGHLCAPRNNQPALTWEPDGRVTVHGLLTAKKDLSLAGLLSIGQSKAKATLAVKGKASTPLTGTVSILTTSAVVQGLGTKFTEELQVGSVFQVDDSIHTVVSIEDATHLTIDKPPLKDLKDVVAQTNGPLLSLTDPTDANQLSVDSLGNVVIGTSSRSSKVTVEGELFARELSGSGAGITKLKATSITGQVKGDQIVSLPAEKITGILSPAQLPPGSTTGNAGTTAFRGNLGMPITGKVSTSSTSNLVSGAGTRFLSELDLQDALKIGAEVFTITGIMDDLNLQLDRNPSQAATAATALRDGNLMTTETGNGFLNLVVDKSGSLTWPLGGGKTASVGAWGAGNLSPGGNVTVAAPIGFLHCTDDNQWCLVWEPGGQVAIRGLLKAYGDLDLRGSLLVGNPGQLLPAFTQASLCVRGKTSTPLTGTVTVWEANRFVQGSGTKFDEELKVGYTLKFDNGIYTVVSIEDATHIEIDRPHWANLANIPAQTNAPLVQMTDPAGTSQFSINAGGDVTIGAAPGYAKLKVEGGIVARDLTGSGAGITGISAANITGQLNPAQIPPIPASKISDQLSVDQIPNLPLSKISGQLGSQAVGPGGRPTLAAGSVSPGATQNIFAIPTTANGGVLIGVYSLEIYTTYLWSDWKPNPAGGGFEGLSYTVMTRTVLAGSLLIVPGTPIQIESMIVSPTQTNHPEPKFPAVSCAIVGNNGQAWLQMQTTTGEMRLAPDVPPGTQMPQVQYYIYSLI